MPTNAGADISWFIKPHFIFRIDEIRENTETAAIYDRYGIWNPSIEHGGNERVHGAGATGIWWYCNGQSIQRLHVNAPPPGSSHFQTFSVFYSSGFGCWVLRGDATSPPAAEAWHPLSFEWDDQDYSSYLTNAGTERTLRVQRNDQIWPSMLLPSTNQLPAAHMHQGYGGLKGDLAIFLALIALSMDRRYVQQILPQMFIQGAWATHRVNHGRESMRTYGSNSRSLTWQGTNQRGVVVYVYTVPSTWDSTSRSTAKELERYQDGVYGKYYP